MPPSDLNRQRIPKLQVRNRVTDDSSALQQSPIVPRTPSPPKGHPAEDDNATQPGSRDPLSYPANTPLRDTTLPLERISSSPPVSQSSPNAQGREKRRSKYGSLLGFLTLKEPSTAAFEEFAEQQRKVAAAKGARMNPVGMQTTPGRKLPADVPKVNSKWDGLPSPKSRRDPQTKNNRDSTYTVGSQSQWSSHTNSDRSTSSYGSKEQGPYAPSVATKKSENLQPSAAPKSKSRQEPTSKPMKRASAPQTLTASLDTSRFSSTPCLSGPRSQYSVSPDPKSPASSGVGTPADNYVTSSSLAGSDTGSVPRLHYFEATSSGEDAQRANDPDKVVVRSSGSGVLGPPISLPAKGSSIMRHSEDTRPDTSDEVARTGTKVKVRPQRLTLEDTPDNYSQGFSSPRATEERAPLSPSYRPHSSRDRLGLSMKVHKAEVLPWEVMGGPSFDGERPLPASPTKDERGRKRLSNLFGRT